MNTTASNADRAARRSGGGGALVSGEAVDVAKGAVTAATRR